MSTFTPTNRLEELLVLAATEPAARPDFYRELLASTVYVITPDKPATESVTVLAAGTTFKLVSWQGESGPIVPIFSSRERLEETARAGGEAIGVLGITGKALFEVLTQQPQTAVLNPGLACGKELTPDEVRRLADGSIFTAGERREIKKATQVLLGQPAVYPTRFAEALKTLFRDRESVRAGYLAQVFMPESDAAPHPLIGIDSSDYAKDVADAGLVAKEVGDLTPVDFVEIRRRENAGLSSYLLEKTKPFYERPAAKPWWKVW